MPNLSVTRTINGSWSSSIIRDTGCSGVVISKEALPDINPSLYPKVQVADYLGHIDEFSVIKCYLGCPFYTSWTDAVRALIKFASALVGNIPGVQDADSPDSLLSNDNHLLHSNHDQATTDFSCKPRVLGSNPRYALTTFHSLIASPSGQTLPNLLLYYPQTGLTTFICV